MKERQLAGEIAVEVARDVAEPIRALRDRLGLVVDHLERHVATSTGPTPYPWRSLQTLRQDLGGAYLEVTQLARRLEELDRALAMETPAEPFSIAAAVDLGLRLAGHHLGPDIELLVDLGEAPPVRGSSGTLALVVAQLVSVCARSARGAQGSTLTVRVGTEDGAGAITIADNGAGDSRVETAAETARAIIGAWHGTLDVASAPGQGCVFELRFTPTPAP
jgi:signal transduction histidine kinase